MVDIDIDSSTTRMTELEDKGEGRGVHLRGAFGIEYLKYLTVRTRRTLRYEQRASIRP